MPAMEHDLTHMPYRSWCFGCVAGRGADDPHRKEARYTGSFRSRVHLVNPDLTTFYMIDRESQALAAALCVKAASDLVVRLFLAILDAWGRSEIKVVLCADQEVTVTLREELARRRRSTPLECSPAESHATKGATERVNRTLGEMLRTTTATREGSPTDQ